MEDFGIGEVISNFPESVINDGFIHKDSIDDYIE